jgi:hypothetical protein
MRRGELGHHHHIAGVYFVRYAQEAAWREDHRGISPTSPTGLDFCDFRVGFGE